MNKSANIKSIDVKLDDTIEDFFKEENNKINKKDTIEKYKTLIIKAKQKGISSQLISFKINKSRSVIDEYVRKLKYLGELKI
jgi:ribosome-binding protein aMBF1 (putative translation factor)